MKQVRHISHWLLAALLFSGVLDASALTLGRIHGAVIVGRPLDVTVAVEFGADEDATPDARVQCYGADVRYGDTQLAAGAVQLQVAPGANAQTHNIRIRSSVRIDEPMVSVSLQAGCGRTTLRRYVVLAEMLSDSLPDAVAPVADVTAASSSVAKSVAQPVSAPASAAAAPAEAAAAAKPTVGKRKTSAHKSSSRRSRLKLNDVAQDTPAQRTGKPARRPDRLVLDDLEQRVDALAQWKETMPAAQQNVQLQERVQAFEGTLKGLQALTLKNQQNLQVVATDLERIQEGTRDGNLLLYVLSAILALCVAAVAWLVLRVRAVSAGDSSSLWSVHAKVDKSAVPAASQSASEGGSGFASTAAKSAVNSPAQTSPGSAQALTLPMGGGDELPLDIDIGAGAAAFAAMDTEPGFSPQTVVRDPDRRDFQPSVAATLRSLNTREMLDVRQQAEFFMALGQHDEAVKVLQSSINQSQYANPLVILDLLKIFYTLGRRSEFDHYRQEFNLQFTGRVPEYASFMLETHGLETYADICSEIAALWPSGEAVDYIEQCLVRTTEDAPDQGFDLEAYRDLLMLHAVLKRLDPGQDSDLMPFSTMRTPHAGPEGTHGTYKILDSVVAEGALVQPTFSLPGEEADVQGVDLDLTEKADNLIDFNISGFTLDKPPAQSK